MLLLIYSDPNDPVTKTLLSRPRDLDEELSSLSIQELLSDVEIFDRIEDGIPSLRWTLPSGVVITNASQVKLINRAINVAPELFSDFHPEDQDYAAQEFWAYLSFALEAFARKTVAPSFLGLAGPHAPLPYQWHKAGTLGIATPNYYLGAHGLMPMDATSPWLVKSNVFDHYRWKPMTEPLPRRGEPGYDENEIIFVFERPLGEPVSVFVAGDDLLYAKPTTIGDAWPEQSLEQSALAITKEFATHFAELLFFVTPEAVTFGTLILVPSPRTVGLAGFDDLIINSLNVWGRDD